MDKLGFVIGHSNFRIKRKQESSIDETNLITARAEVRKFSWPEIKSRRMKPINSKTDERKNIIVNMIICLFYADCYVIMLTISSFRLFCATEKFIQT